jgi:hypothetical protein
MPLRFAIICATFLFAGPFLSSDKETETHAVNPPELYATIDRADKVVVRSEFVDEEDSRYPTGILYTSVNPKDISELRESLTILSPKQWFRCACLPLISIELSRKGKELGVISIYEEMTIGFSPWEGDVLIRDGGKLLNWFEARGISEQLGALAEEWAKEKAVRAGAEHWFGALPASLRASWSTLMDDQNWWLFSSDVIPAFADSLKPSLAREFPGVKERIRALFSWFGSGAGPWSGYPAYEDVASHLLLEYQASDLLAAIQGVPLTESQMEGAARFFSGYCYAHQPCPPEDSTLIPLIPNELKRSFLAHALKSSDQDKVERSRRAFGRM